MQKVSVTNRPEAPTASYYRGGFARPWTTDESTLDDLGVDSLGVLAIADIVENKYGISLDDERIAGVRTLSDFKDLIVLKIAEMA